LPEVHWGIVAKVDLAYFQAPFWQAGIIITVGMIIGEGIGVFLFFQVGQLNLKSDENILRQQQFLQDLQKEHNNLIQILENTGNLIVVLDSQLRIIFINKTCENTIHYTSAEVIGEKFIEFLILPEENEKITDLLSSLGPENPSITHTNYWLTKEREMRLIAWTNTVIVDKQGNIVYFVKNGIDITEKDVIEKALFKSEAQFRAIFAKSNLGMAILDQEGKILNSNHELQYLLNYSKDFLEHQKFQDLLCFPDQENFQKYHQEMVLNSRDYFQAEICCLSEDQQMIEAQLVVSGVRDEQGIFEFAVAMLQDITARKNAEKAKALMMKRNQMLIGALGQIIYCHNILTDRLEWEGNYHQILGYDAETMGNTGQIWLQRIHPEDKQCALEDV